MEEQFKKNKKKQATASDKMDTDTSDDSREDSNEKVSEGASPPDSQDGNKMSDVSEASVIVETPGTSGNVERLSE